MALEVTAALWRLDDPVTVRFPFICPLVNVAAAPPTLPPTSKFPPTNNFLAIATPPSVLIEAAEVAEVASVDSVISNSSDN